MASVCGEKGEFELTTRQRRSQIQKNKNLVTL